MLIHYIASRTRLPEKNIQNVVDLVSRDSTVPFIARYRKEQTGNLDEVAIAEIVGLKNNFEALESRKKTILSALKSQQAWTPELEKSISTCIDLVTLEDIYLPYKKKRKTKAETARGFGLEPLAKIIMSQRVANIEFVAKQYVSKNVPSVDVALEGARHIIAEWLNERFFIRNVIRQHLKRSAVLHTKVVKEKATDEKAQKFKTYFNHSEALHKIASHRLLAILRAESEGVIKFKIEVDTEKIRSVITARLLHPHSTTKQHIELALKDAYKRLLFPSLSNEILQYAKQKADDAAIAVFENNLKQLLLAAPLGEKRVLAIDPGFRSGCKTVCLDAQGKLLHNETVYPHAPQNAFEKTKRKLQNLIEAYKIEAIAIGNGTASRETEAVIKTLYLPQHIEVFIVNEAGASIYSASKIAREEFPNYDVTVRGAVSIGRRLQDPLAELVKIEPKSIGVGQYQHDVDQAKLKLKLDAVVEHCVNKVGVNLNTASKSLLMYVSGISKKLAEHIVTYRYEHGAFTSREALKKVPRLGAKAFEQCAGFLRIKAAKNPLDDSAVHPESYAIVYAMASDLKHDVKALVGHSEILKTLKLECYYTKTIGLPSLKDIVNELQKPGLDIRHKIEAVQFDSTLKTIADLNIGQQLTGIVNNITNFGCFVNIGIKESGLIHVSKLSKEYVSDVSAHVSLQQKVTVKVLEVDVSRKRIQLELCE